jgi:flagellar hook-associated protein 2
MVSFSGVGSGLDLSALVEQVVAAEKIPAQAMTARKNNATKQATALGDLVSKLKSLDTKLASFDTKSELRSVAAATSDAARVKVTASGEALPGAYRIRVQTLAQAQTTRSTPVATADTLMTGSGSLTIQVGSESSETITFGTSDTLADIATRINETDASVSASVLFNGTDYRLVISSQKTGAENAITFSEGGTSLGMELPGANVSAATDAVIEMNGMTISRPSNQMSDILPGVTFDLLSPTPSGSAETDLTVTADQTGVKTKVKEFVDTYNEVAKFMLAQMNDGTKGNAKSNLFGDSSMQSLQRGLGGIIAKGYAYGPAGQTSLGELGIKLGTDGTLSLDETKFDKKYTEFPDKLEELFAGETGLVAGFKELVERYTDGTEGLLLTRQKGLQTQVASYEKTIESINTRAEAVGSRLSKQFTALDKTMAELQSQTAYLSSLFA